MLRHFAIACLLLCSIAFAQNTCDYSATAFAVCLTKFGTLHDFGYKLLDPNNPVEGWVLQYTDQNKVYHEIWNVPGEGLTYPATVTQPNGPTTLPIIFTYDLGGGAYMKAVVSAFGGFGPLVLRFQMKVHPCSKCHWTGVNFFRAVNLTPDGDSQAYFGNAHRASFAYSPSSAYDSSGVLLTGVYGGAGIAPDVSQVLTATCGTPIPSSLQQGAIFSMSPGLTGNFTYSAFD